MSLTLPPGIHSVRKVMPDGIPYREVHDEKLGRWVPSSCAPIPRRAGARWMPIRLPTVPTTTATFTPQPSPKRCERVLIETDGDRPSGTGLGNCRRVTLHIVGESIPVAGVPS